MQQFSAETQKIIDNHKADFNCTNYISKLNSYGGYNAYIDSLGGVFKKYRNFNGKVSTVQQFKEIAEYVWGLYHIYGFDYYNGTTYVRWTGGSPFYVNNQKGRCNGGKIDDLCGLSSKDKTTCCNWAIDTFLFKLGILPNGNQKYCTQASYGTLITDKNDLQIGDIVHFYKDSKGVFNPKNPSTYGQSGWHHVVIVWDVTPTSIIVADGGSRLQRNKGKWLYEVPKTGKGFGGDYGTSDKWMAKRIFTLKSTPNVPSKENKTIEDMAIEVILGHDINGGSWGNGDIRKNNLGEDYNAVQYKVNELLKNEESLQKALVRYILMGKAGNGDIRKQYLGDRYQLGQDGVDKIKTAINNFYNSFDNEWRKLVKMYMRIE